MSRFDLFFVILDECNENIDRHLATHIVNLHMLKDDSIEPEFSTEQLQRYIRFAKTFKPVFTPEAKTLLVQKYKELRADDSGGVGRNSYRITVRQLESLIRLSEAIAKANCVEDVTEAMVLEAFSLLRLSIISVEKDDVDVEDEDIPEIVQPNGDREDSPMADAGEGPSGYIPATGEVDGEARPRQRTKITFDKYNKMLNILARRINEEEQTTGDGIGDEELQQWYLESIEEELQTEEDLTGEQELVKKVLKRMVKVRFFFGLDIEMKLLTKSIGQRDHADSRRGRESR
jgi:DNA replication licensing factor MCM6